MTVPIAPPDYQGDWFTPDGTPIVRAEPWWLNYPRRADSPDAVASEPAPLAEPTPPMGGGWTSAFGYVSPTNWPAS